MSYETEISQIPLDPYIGGRRHRIAGAVTFPSYDPANGKVLSQVPVADEHTVDQAVSSAKDALTGDWGRTLPAERSRILSRVAQFLRRDAEKIAVIESVDSGKPLREAKGDVETSARYFEYYAGMADKLQGHSIPLGPQFLSMTLHEPVGVTAHIIPWNFPLVTTARGLAPALAVGATAVIKPAEQTPLTALLLPQYLAEAGLPDGACNVVCGPGRQTGQHLVSHPEVAHITFTGSVETGKTVMRSAAEHVTAVTLELGGKSPVVVLSDANMSDALEGVIKAIFTNSGQVCSAGSRLIIEESCAQQFLEKLQARVNGFGFGRGLDNPDLGPLVSVQQLAKVDGIVQQAKASGIEVLAGGRVRGVPGLEGGWFFEPTILLAKDQNSAVVQDEIFGPVLTVQIANDLEHAVALAACRT